MTVFGYLRVSTFEQDTEKNKNEILHFANDKKLGNVEFVDEKISGTKNFKDRKLGILLEEIKKGDILIVPELSRLARSISQILQVIEICKQKQVIIYSLKENFSTKDECIQSKVTSTIFALVAEIERDLISKRTKEALQARKMQGFKLGRPKGKGKSKLDIHKEEIHQLLSLGVPKSKIAERFNTTTPNLYNWMRVTV